MAERRRNPLTDEWVIVSPGRVQRPWQGETATEPAPVAEWSADCHLCPRNARSTGALNPDYRGVWLFDNDFPALDDAPAAPSQGPLFERERVNGRCRVVCYSPHHARGLAALAESEVVAVIDAWRDETVALGRDHAWVQTFENRGRAMGASSEHPHGQIWASSHLPTLPAREDRAQRDYRTAHRGSLLLDYARLEVAAGERVVVANATWVAVVPFWAAWPFETLLLPLAPCSGFDALGPVQAAALADALRRLLAAYDRLFGVPFPYSMGWHGRVGELGDHWQLHAHFYPPLLRSASVRKYMVGYEMLAESQRDLTAEAAAARLRDLVGD